MRLSNNPDTATHLNTKDRSGCIDVPAIHLDLADECFQLYAGVNAACSLSYRGDLTFEGKLRTLKILLQLR